MGRVGNEWLRGLCVGAAFALAGVSAAGLVTDHLDRGRAVEERITDAERSSYNVVSWAHHAAQWYPPLGWTSTTSACWATDSGATLTLSSE